MCGGPGHFPSGGALVGPLEELLDPKARSRGHITTVRLRRPRTPRVSCLAPPFKHREVHLSCGTETVMGPTHLAAIAVLNGSWWWNGPS